MSSEDSRWDAIVLFGLVRKISRRALKSLEDDLEGTVDVFIVIVN
jgi:hypothetical protein